MTSYHFLPSPCWVQNSQIGVTSLLPVLSPLVYHLRQHCILFPIRQLSFATISLRRQILQLSFFIPVSRCRKGILPMKKIFLETKTQQGRTGFYSMVIFTLALYPISLFFAEYLYWQVGMLACSGIFFWCANFLSGLPGRKSFLEKKKTISINGAPVHYRRFFLHNLSC